MLPQSRLLKLARSAAREASDAEYPSQALEGTASLYIPNTDQEQREMLQRIGARSLAELFNQIPEKFRLRGLLDIPSAFTEMELHRHLSELAAANQSCDRTVCFLGGGCYDHFVPAVVDVIGSRSEYYTAYTPYQPEASQGTLQVGFEYQTLMCQLTGLDVSNASLYEGATAMVEAALLARGTAGQTGKIVVSEAVHPEYRRTLATYLENLDTKLVVIPAPSGRTDLEALRPRRLTATRPASLFKAPTFLG